MLRDYLRLYRHFNGWRRIYYLTFEFSVDKFILMTLLYKSFSYTRKEDGISFKKTSHRRNYPMPNVQIFFYYLPQKMRYIWIIEIYLNYYKGIYIFHQQVVKRINLQVKFFLTSNYFRLFDYTIGIIVKSNTLFWRFC